MEGSWVKGCPMRKCPGDRKKLWWSLEREHKSQEFKHASTSDNKVESSSYVAMFAPKVRLRWYFTDLTAASQRPPKCGPCGGINFHWHPSDVKKSWTLDICVGHWSMLSTARWRRLGSSCRYPRRWCWVCLDERWIVEVLRWRPQSWGWLLLQYELP